MNCHNTSRQDYSIPRPADSMRWREIAAISTLPLFMSPNGPSPCNQRSSQIERGYVITGDPPLSVANIITFIASSVSEFVVISARRHILLYPGVWAILTEFFNCAFGFCRGCCYWGLFRNNKFARNLSASRQTIINNSKVVLLKCEALAV